MDWRDLISSDYKNLDLVDQRINYIVTGFIRTIHETINDKHHQIYAIIPNVIVILLINYIGDSFLSNEGLFEWKITDNKLIDAIKTAENKQNFVSNSFSVGKLEWQLELFPNGNHDQRRGLFGVFLKCMELPSTWEYIFILRTIECKETNSKYTFVTKCQSKQSKGWASGSLYFEDVMFLNQLTFTVKIRILQIHLSRYGHKYYSYRSPSKYLANKWNFHVSWQVNKELMEKFRKARFGQIFEKDEIVDDMWCLRCCPKGILQGTNGM